MFNVYTDGGCRGNGKSDAVGAWAFIVYDSSGNRVGSRSAGSIGTTNNRMEMQAVNEAVSWANTHKYSITVFLDSNFVKQGCEAWLWGWSRKDWKKSDGETVLNKDLWKDIFNSLLEYKNIHGEIPTFVKVKGHSGDPRNDAVDTLCNVRMTEVEIDNV